MTQTKPDEFNIKIHELEFKYDGSETSLTDFNKFAESMKPTDYIEVCSWDIYYAPPVGSEKTTLPFEFMRLRMGIKPELTIKKKTEDKNNNSRIEIDVPLDPKASQKDIEEVVRVFCKQFGFVENFRVFKYCSIYFYEKFDIVYYIAYNQNLQEQARFIEIEAMKSYPFASPEEALDCIKDIEQKMSVVGLSPQKRMRRSMWERFKKS